MPIPEKQPKPSLPDGRVPGQPGALPSAGREPVRPTRPDIPTRVDRAEVSPSDSNDVGTTARRVHLPQASDSTSPSPGEPPDQAQQVPQEAQSDQRPPEPVNAERGGGGPPPPEYPPSELGELGDGETVLDMPDTERPATMAILDSFAREGEPYEQEHLFEGELENEQGYRHTIPRAALAAQGLDYEVEVITLDTSEPFIVGITATREVSIESPMTDGEVEERRVVGGVEVKDVSFFMQETRIPGSSPMITIEAESSLADPRFAMPIEGPPLLTLEEMRAVISAIAYAGEHASDSPETAAALATQATLGRTEFSDVEIPEGGERYTDLSQEARGALMSEIDTYARGGEQEQTSSYTRYTRDIPDEVLSAHGFEGSAQAVVIEDPYGAFYVVGITTVQVMERTLPSQDRPALGVKEGYLAVFAVVGPKTGTSASAPTIGKKENFTRFVGPDASDEAAGDGLHIEYGGQESYEDPHGRRSRWLLPASEITYGEVRSLFQALRQVTSSVEGQSDDANVPTTEQSETVVSRIAANPRKVLGETLEQIAEENAELGNILDALAMSASGRPSFLRGAIYTYALLRERARNNHQNIVTVSAEVGQAYFQSLSELLNDTSPIDDVNTWRSQLERAGEIQLMETIEGLPSYEQDPASYYRGAVNTYLLIRSAQDVERMKREFGVEE